MKTLIVIYHAFMANILFDESRLNCNMYDEHFFTSLVKHYFSTGELRSECVSLFAPFPVDVFGRGSIQTIVIFNAD